MPWKPELEKAARALALALESAAPDALHAALVAECDALVKTAVKEGEAVGTLGTSKPSVREMFECVYKEPDWRIIRQRQELGV